jgi:hypothetical protein
VNALFVGLLISGTAILSVALGIFGAYFAINGILAAVNPSRPANAFLALVPNQNHASGD